MVPRWKGGALIMQILSPQFRIILFLISVLVFFVVARSVRKKKIRMGDGIFWILFSMMLVLFCVFPQIAVWMSSMIGVQAPSNGVFLVIIFLLICHQFAISLHLSQLNMKYKKLAQDIAIERTLHKEDEH